MNGVAPPAAKEETLKAFLRTIPPSAARSGCPHGRYSPDLCEFWNALLLACQGFSPIDEFLQDLLPRTAFPVNGPSPESVVPQNVVRVLAKQPIKEGLVELQRGQVLVQGVTGHGTERKLELVVSVDHRALVVVLLGAELLPAPIGPEVNALVFRGIDVAGPEKANVAVAKDVLGCLAAKREINVMGGYQLEPSPALQLEGWRRWLVQFCFAVGQFLEIHRCVARLKEELAVVYVPQFFVAVKDVLQIETGNCWHEKTRRLIPAHPDGSVDGCRCIPQRVARGLRCLRSQRTEYRPGTSRHRGLIGRPILIERALPA
jgi:hypothetical protein